MALVQLDKWTFDTVGEKTLLQIGDLSNISSQIAEAKALSPTSKITGLNVSYISVSGDDVCSYGSGSTEYTLLENEYVKFTYGKTTNSSGGVLYGAALKDKMQDANAVDVGWGGSGWGSGKLRIGVILDTSEQRGYLLWNYYSSNSGWGLWLVGGTTNGTDIIWETFKSAIIPVYTSNGGGATHIAKVTGQLKDLSSNLSDILMVSGGGGGGLLLGDSGWHGTEQNIAWSGNNNKLTVQLDDDDVLFKMYIGSSNIYSFTAPVSDISNIYLQFLIDSENEVAKPSFVYKNGSSYSFNQEEPTDEEMADIYTWLSAGLPSE